MRKLSIFQKALNFEKKCLDLNDSIIKKIENRLPLISGSPKEMRKNQFFRQITDLFNSNSGFIITILEEGKRSNLEPIRNILRTLMELYCRVLYLNNIKERKMVKLIIGMDFYTTALLETKFKIKNHLLSTDEKIAISQGINLYSKKRKNKFRPVKLCNINNLKKWLIEEATTTKSEYLQEFRNRFWFPGVKKIIRKYLNENEEPQLKKIDFSFIYSAFSEQVHGNPYFGYYKRRVKDPSWQILGFLTLIDLRFLKEISSLGNLLKDNVEELIKEWKRNIQKDFLSAWKATNFPRIFQRA